MNLGRFAYQLAFEKSPIFLNDGLAELMHLKVLPLISITEGIDIVRGLATGTANQITLDNFLATFYPMPGSKLVSYQAGQYPFANQKTAANSIIKQALSISIRMNVTPKAAGGMMSRTAVMMAMKAALEYHCEKGGYFTIATPANMYTGCLLMDITDITSGESKHQQTDWQFNFIQPLISLAEAADIAKNGKMSAIDNGIKP
jgi:hypothetical protein